MVEKTTLLSDLIFTHFLVYNCYVIRTVLNFGLSFAWNRIINWNKKFLVGLYCFICSLELHHNIELKFFCVHGYAVICSNWCQLISIGKLVVTGKDFSSLLFCICIVCFHWITVETFFMAAKRTICFVHLLLLL